MVIPIETNLNLLAENKLITRQGFYTDFVDKSIFDTNFANNATNTTGDLAFRTTPYFLHLVPVDGVTPTQARGIKYFKTNTLSPRTGLPWPTFVDLRMEALVGKQDVYEALILGDDVNLLGFAVSHGDQVFTTAANKFWVGIYRDSAGNDGARLIRPDGTTENNTTITIGSGNTEHFIYVQMIYDFFDDPVNIKVNFFVDGVQAFTDELISRDDLGDGRLDGWVGIAIDVPPGTGSAGGAVGYSRYLAINRIEHPISVEYRNTLLYSIPEANLDIPDFEFETMRSLGKDSLIDIFVREGYGLERSYVNYKVRTADDIFSDSDFATGLLIRYELEGNVRDRSGSGNNGSLQGTSPVYVDYGDTKYVDLPGTDEYIDVPDLTFGTNLTIAFWIKVDAVGSSGERILSFGQTVQSLVNAFNLYRSGTTTDLVFDVYNGAGASLTGGGTMVASGILITGRWIFVAVTVNATTAILFVNNEAQDMASMSASLPNVTRDENRIGGGWDATTTFFPNNNVRNLYLWNRELNADELELLYLNTFLINVERLAQGLTARIDLNGDLNDETDIYNVVASSGSYVNILGGFRQARRIDVLASHVLPDIPSTYDWSNGFTIAFWVKFTINGVQHAPFGIMVGTANNNYAIKCRKVNPIDHKLDFIIYNSVGTVIYTLLSNVDDVITHKNTHVMIRQDAVNAKMFIDGVEVDSVATTTFPPNVNRDFHLGSAGSGGTGYTKLDGDLWDFRLWNRALSDVELDAVFRSTVYKRRWSGFVYDVTKDDETSYGMVRLPAYHISKVLDNRYFTGTFSSKTADFIITDGSTGIMPLQAPEFDITNVDTGKFSLDKEFLQSRLRSILLRLAADEDYLAWITNDKELFFKVAGAIDSGREFKDGDPFLMGYKIEQFVPEEYTDVEIHSTNVWTVYSTGAGRDRDADKRTLRIIDPTVKNQADAEFVASRAIKDAKPILLGTLEIIADYNLVVGNVVRVSIQEYNIVNRKFIITEILETPDFDMQIITIAENTAQLSDYFYQLDTRASDTDVRDMDSDATKTYVEVLDVDVVIWFEYTVESRPAAGTWTTFASGSGEPTNRAFAIVSGNLANRNNAAGATEGTVNNITHRIGGSPAKPQVTDQVLGLDFGSANEKLDSTPTVDVNDLPFSQTQATWATGDSNGKLIREAGIFMPIATAGNTTYKYGTTSDFAPFNNDTDLMARITFPAFLKASTNELRITYKWRADTVEKKRLVEV